MSERILLVDDDTNLLSALQRHLRKRFDLVTAEGGAAAIDAILDANKAGDPFAVVLSDMRMPGMDGIETLKQIRQLSPDTVRMMLTGNADQQTAIDAINLGNIFRFFTKPCPPDNLAVGLQAGLDQYRLVTAERELLEKTLAGSIKVLVDVVSINDPVSYSLASRLREWVRFLQVEFQLPHRWQLEVAASLLPLGQVSIPPELIARQRSGETLTSAELSLFTRAPEAGRNLIVNIPRLASVAEIVYLQDRGFDGSGFPSDGPTGNDIPIDARLLKILKDLAEACAGGPPVASAFAQLEKNRGHYDPVLLKKVRTCLECKGIQPGSVSEVPVAALRAGVTLVSDLRLSNGHLILAGGTLLSTAMIERIHNLRQTFAFTEPIKVLI